MTIAVRATTTAQAALSLRYTAHFVCHFSRRCQQRHPKINSVIQTWFSSPTVDNESVVVDNDNRSAVTPSRCLAAKLPEGNTKTEILPVCPSPESSGPDAEIFSILTLIAAALYFSSNTIRYSYKKFHRTIDRFSRPERFDTDPNTQGSADIWEHWFRTFTKFLEEIASYPPDKLKTLFNYVVPTVYRFIKTVVQSQKTSSTINRDTSVMCYAYPSIVYRDECSSCLLQNGANRKVYNVWLNKRRFFAATQRIVELHGQQEAPNRRLVRENQIAAGVSEVKQFKGDLTNTQLSAGFHRNLPLVLRKQVGDPYSRNVCIELIIDFVAESFIQYKNERQNIEWSVSFVNMPYRARLVIPHHSLRLQKQCPQSKV
ncbi:hypothetical protein CLF_102951 [Clonorchis sinensis]|uniref:Uncharacterized protein n=1 Tax=Clonorchis sinensis TaxID=79923 RepID=G7Y8V0_CLOSI|nr:hypothetical protein CLF_102951 [Clonorchis sinensis]